MKFSWPRFLEVAAATAFSIWAGSAQSQSFPTRNITIIVPYAAGGAADVAARLVGEHMGSTLGKRVLIENVSGGSGMIGTGRVARATADGYTVLVDQLALAANVTLFPKAPFDVEKDLVGVGLINYSPLVIMGRKSLPTNSLAELSRWMKQAGQRARFAHAGLGTSSHLCAVLFVRSMGAQVEMIPYRGAAPAISDIIAGHVDLYCTPPGNVAEYVKFGTLKAYGITSRDTVDGFFDVPSLVQLGFADLEVRFWQGMFAPAGTPKPILETLNAALRLALADHNVRKSFEQADYSVFPMEEQTTAAADHLLRAEIARWGEIIRTNNIEAVR
jgi:tripartite-type tricarboxylate transporter receptor subunit TctC